jgi:large subunit ribosomal protein L10
VRRKEKEQIVNELKEKFKQNENIIFVDFKGISVAQSNELRRRMRENNSYFKVIKNRLMKKALESMDNKIISIFRGPTAIVYNNHDPVKLAKALISFSNENNILRIKGGLLRGKFIEENKIKEIANLPSKETLMVKFAFLMASPLINMLQLLKTPIMNFGILLQQLRDKK